MVSFLQLAAEKKTAFWVHFVGPSYFVMALDIWYKTNFFHLHI